MIGSLIIGALLAAGALAFVLAPVLVGSRTRIDAPAADADDPSGSSPV